MQTLLHTPLRMVWLKAAVMGSFWASMEIIMGSFLHNLRIPFAGTILACVAVWLMVAFVQVWKEDGLLWRAGLVAALMKSLSPSAVILGPMLGIFTEALLMNLAVVLLGRRPLAYLIGGGLAVLSTLGHKILNLIVLYGFDLIRVADAVFRVSAEAEFLPRTSLRDAVFLLAGLYIAAGLVAALAGYASGKGFWRRGKKTEAGFGGFHRLDTASVSEQKTSELFRRSRADNYAAPLLFLNLGAVVLALLLINGPYPLAAALFSAAYLVFCFFRYRRAVHRIRKWSFWIPFVLITLAAALLLDGIGNGWSLSTTGLLTGLRMNARALIVLTGFTAISTEMKNPAIKLILYNKGFASLYQALRLSFSALPALLDYLSDQKGKIRTWRPDFAGIAAAAETMLEAFKKEDVQKSPLIIVSGHIGQGKTSFARSMAEHLNKMELPTGGFLSPGKHNEKGERTGFCLQPLNGEKPVLLCSIHGKREWPKGGKYYFNPSALQKGRQLLLPGSLAGKSVVVIDEVGPLEINDRGWAPAIETLLRSRQMVHCWVVRLSLARKMARKWDVGSVYLFDAGNDHPEEAARLAALLARTTDRPPGKYPATGVTETHQAEGW